MSPADDVPDGDTWPAAPTAVPGCLECSNHATAHTYAVATGDPTGATDADVRLRRHLDNAHA